MTTDSDAFMPRPPCAILVAIQAVGKAKTFAVICSERP